jgi:hypothetical protein
MPIEIKEVIIRTTVEKELQPPGNFQLQLKEIEDLKKEVLRNCEQMISKAIKNQNRR